jgi:DNA end-binding protein Ku
MRSRYQDHYREKVKELIDAKVHGREIVPVEEEKPAGVLNLMDALKKSVDRLDMKHNGKSRRHSA